MTIKDCMNHLYRLRVFYDLKGSEDPEVQESCAILAEALGMAIEWMKQSQWTNAQDRPPVVEDSYIICTDRGAVCAAHYYPQKNRWNNPYNGHVLCWMPFPEPPEAE